MCCIVIVMNTPHGQRGIILGPSHINDAEAADDWLKNTNISYSLFCDKGDYFHSFQGKLLNSDEIQCYILEALNLPENFI